MWSLYCVLFTPNRCHTGMLCIIGNNNNNSNKPATTTPATGTNKQLWQQCDIGNQFVPTTGNSICKSAIVAGSRCVSAFIYICMYVCACACADTLRLNQMQKCGWVSRTYVCMCVCCYRCVIATMTVVLLGLVVVAVVCSFLCFRFCIQMRCAAAQSVLC